MRSVIGIGIAAALLAACRSGANTTADVRSGSGAAQVQHVKAGPGSVQPEVKAGSGSGSAVAKLAGMPVAKLPGSAVAKLPGSAVAKLPGSAVRPEAKASSGTAKGSAKPPVKAATAASTNVGTSTGTGSGSAKPQRSGLALYDSLLQRYCRAGRVAYSRMARESKAEIERVVRWLGAARPPSARAGKLAFYLNAYNALVIAAVVRRSPGFRGVMTVPGFFKRLRHRVAGRQVTLDQLENRIIRPTFKDPRVHFALVCGAASCPPLRCRAFRASGLHATLQGLTRRFINSARGVRLPAAPNAAPQVSALFKWYAVDFKSASGSPAKYIARYHRGAAKRLETATRLDYLPYSWALNGN